MIKTKNKGTGKMKKNITPPLLFILAMTSYSSSYADTLLRDVDGNLVRTLDGSNHNGVTGTITLDDWGFVGPNGRRAEDFEPVNGFGNGVYTAEAAEACIADPAACGIGQMQHVVTTGPDGLTQDPVQDIEGDLQSPNGPYPQANVDSLTTFYKWGYTTVAGSTFSNMLIDFDGDYQIAKDDMAFEFYNVIDYQQVVPEGGTRVGTTADGPYNNRLAFQPYALSDAKGWCGSVLAAHPNAHEAMAGQVTFDVAFDVYNVEEDGSLTYYSTEITRGFQMRSFGDISLDVTYSDGSTIEMYATAIVNNTDPTVVNKSVGPDTPVGDPAIWHNKVSFMGADVIPGGAGYGDCGTLTPEWAAGERGPGIKKFASLWEPTDILSCVLSGGEWQTTAFPGMPYILRADGVRVPDYFDPSYGPDPMTTDTDSDGIMDYADNCPANSNPGQTDTDNDGLGNACDSDDDNDGLSDSAEANAGTNPLIADTDGDGANDGSDAFPLDASETTDTDNDGIGDNGDNCPAAANADQKDSGGLDTNTPDGIGDACQCGDVSGNGRITNTDSVLMKRYLLGLPSNFDADLCDVNGDDQCTNTDAVLIQRSLLGLPPGLSQTCTAAGN